MDKIAVAQTTSSGNWRENIEKAKQYIKKATEEEAVMIIFPEYFMNYYPDAEHNYTKKAQSSAWRICTGNEDACKRV